MHLRTSAGVYLLVIATALVMGLRFEIGADWFSYLGHYDAVQLLDPPAALRVPGFDIGYSLIVFASTRLNGEMWLVNLCCAMIMMLGIMRFCSRQPNPALCLVVAIPYLVIVVGMGYTRQGVAIGLILGGLADIDGKSVVKATLFIFAAALFHKTALSVLPIVFAPLARRNLLYAFFAALIFILSSILLLRDSADQLISTYVNADYESGGVIIRVSMNFLPAILALKMRRKLGFNSYQSDMWSLFGIVAIATLPIALIASSTTWIDRLALFLIPLQVAILPRMPYIFGEKKSINAQLLIAVVGYSASVQLIWLVFATHAEYWVPYISYINRT